jgi:hypothetical protein
MDVGGVNNLAVTKSVVVSSNPSICVSQLISRGIWLGDIALNKFRHNILQGMGEKKTNIYSIDYSCAG